MPNSTHDENCPVPSKRRRKSPRGSHTQEEGCTPAQLAAMARYRVKNQAALREKARERMARRRALLAENPEDRAQYRERARAADARYREGKAGRLRSRQVDRRAMAYIEKYGPNSWLERAARREKIAASIAASTPARQRPQQTATRVASTS
ncbi:hypothetical protein R3P38DRAFT_3187803 [Favolaschia claudopus]|uniref:Uncharacterized protein n=1 Tax=Favolaschia claudopus TaxID=2862362 RepID=A0AAW0BCN0_9AGAR